MTAFYVSNSPGNQRTHRFCDIMSLIMLGGWHGQSGHEIEGQWRGESAHQQGISQQRVSICVAWHEQVEPKSAHLEEGIVRSLHWKVYMICLVHFRNTGKPNEGKARTAEISSSGTVQIPDLVESEE